MLSIPGLKQVDGAPASASFDSNRMQRNLLAGRAYFDVLGALVDAVILWRCSIFRLFWGILHPDPAKREKVHMGNFQAGVNVTVQPRICMLLEVVVRAASARFFGWTACCAPDGCIF